MSLQRIAIRNINVVKRVEPTSVHQSRQMSSLNDKIADKIAELFQTIKKKKGRQPDELDQVHFQITRLNDTMAGAQATLLDKMQGPAAGNATRERFRQKRTALAWNDLLNNVQDERKKKMAASAFLNFQDKETARRDRLRQAMQTWRDRQLESLIKNVEKKPASGFFSNVFQRFQRNSKSAPLKVLQVFRDQLVNETKLFMDLAKAGIELETVRSIVADASSMMDPSSENIAKKSITTNADSSAVQQQSQDDTKFVYVLDFKGDTRASKAKQLTDEISAILSLPTNLLPCEVILRLNSQGGTVTGYGRCSAELTRLIKAEVSLTVCVDEIAASGGYLMASVAQTIYAAPFAAIGSIGVVASTPNVARRMEDEGVRVIQSTAGKYKRTVTPWKEPEPEELEKLQEDVDTIQKHFVSHVGRHRGVERVPDPLEVATGEVWYGRDALEKGLVDDLMTSEEYIQGKIKEGYEVLHVKKKASGMSLPWWLTDYIANGESGRSSLDLPMLQQMGVCSLGMGADAAKKAMLSSDELRSLSEGISSSERRALIKALLRAESF